MLSYQPGRLKNEALVLDIIFSFSRNLGGLYVYIILNLPSKIYESDVFFGRSNRPRRSVKETSTSCIG